MSKIHQFTPDPAPQMVDYYGLSDEPLFEFAAIDREEIYRRLHRCVTGADFLATTTNDPDTRRQQIALRDTLASVMHCLAHDDEALEDLTNQ